MKTYVLLILILAAGITAHSKIRNGYECEIQTARDGLRALEALWETRTHLPLHARSTIKAEIQRHKTFILYHELTDRMLLQFSIIAPEMFHEMDTLHDARGRLVDIYVMLTPPESMSGSVAASNNLPMDGDRDTYHSKYGIHTALIIVVAGKNALELLAHELGHLSYQVPNVASYRAYYEETYDHDRLQSEERGHNATDPSGQKALLFKKLFYLKYQQFRKDKTRRIEDSFVLRDTISASSD